MRWIAVFSVYVVTGELFSGNLKERIHKSQKRTRVEGIKQKGGRISLGVKSDTMKDVLKDHADGLLYEELGYPDVKSLRESTNEAHQVT